MEKYRALTIAGSDSSGGAGIQADLKTFTALDVYGMSAITSLTAQNTTGVLSIHDCPPDILRDQLDMIFTDIFPDAVKIGMVSSVPLIQVIGESLRKFQPKHVVLDPVMVATSGAKLLAEDAKETLIRDLFPLATIITPNLQEAEELLDQELSTADEVIEGARALGESYDVAVLLKGGHREGAADDYFYSREEELWIRGDRIDNPNTHGTGCTLSSAIAAYLAKGMILKEACVLGKEYVSGALRAQLNLGEGSGPLDHMWNIGGRDE